MTNKQNNEIIFTNNGPVYRVALDERRPSLMAMAEAEIERRSRLDPTAAAITAEASAAKLAEFRPDAVAQFGKSAGAQFDELRPVARAVRQADVEYIGTSATVDVSALNDVVRTDYRLLMTDADGLANRNLIDPARLEPARNVQGYQALIGSVLVLVFVLRERWSEIKDHTPLTEADLDRAESNALHMSAVLGSRDNKAVRAAAAELRVRALSKLIHLYDAILQMMTYLRWKQGDIDVIMPSLWAGRGGRKARTTDDSGDPVIDVAEPQSPAGPVPNNGGAPFVA